MCKILGEEFDLDQEFDNPDHEMFILNVLLGRYEMSILFLGRVNVIFNEKKLNFFLNLLIESYLFGIDCW